MPFVCVAGQGLTFEVAPAFRDEFASGLAASPISRLAVMGSVVLMPKTLGQIIVVLSRIILCCPLNSQECGGHSRIILYSLLTARNTAAKGPLIETPINNRRSDSQ